MGLVLISFFVHLHEVLFYNLLKNSNLTIHLHENKHPHNEIVAGRNLV